MARSYDERERGRDDDWRERDEDERRFRYGGEERGRYEASERDRERQRQPPEWARDPGYGWSTDRGPSDRHYDEHRSREYWRSRENAPWRTGDPGRTVQPWHAREPGPPGESWRSFPPHERSREDERFGNWGQYQGQREFGRDYGPDDQRWREARREEAPGRTTLRGVGAGEQWGSAFQGFGHSRESQRGGFAGKGPRGYVRSDERIREDVCDRLSADDEVDASDITVTVAKGEVTLEGTVPDRHSKRRAEDIAEAINGVNEVHNRLRSHKGLVQEVGDKLMGRPNESGHAGSGTRTSPSGTNVQNNH